MKVIRHNVDIRKCMAKINQKLTRDNLDPTYIWVREQNTSQHPHFHCAVLVDGHKSQNPYRVFSTAERLWKSTIDSESDGLLHRCEKSKNGNYHKNGIMIRKDDENYFESIDEVKRRCHILQRKKIRYSW